MSLYGETKSLVLSVALTSSGLQTRLEELEDTVGNVRDRISNNLKAVELLNRQLETLFQFIRENFNDEEVAMIGKEDETASKEV